MAQQIFNIGEGAGGALMLMQSGKERMVSETKQTKPSNKQKVPYTIKISRPTTGSEISSKRQKLDVEKAKIKYTRPTLDLSATLSFSPIALVEDVLVEVGEGANKEQVVLMMMMVHDMVPR